MSTILQTIADYAKIRAAKDKETTPLSELKQLCAQAGKGGGSAFTAALSRPNLSFICEVKKASPSKGIISEDFPYLQIAKDYEQAGADCISCLTEPKWFMGSDKIFTDIRKTVSIPMLRKDFVVDEYQLYQARLMGADAVLLICALLDTKTISNYIEICHNLGVAALVEAHNPAEIKNAVCAGAEIIGVNNRNLKDFSVNMENCRKLRSLVPNNVLFVAESGIRTHEDIQALAELEADAVLVGETLMRAENKSAALSSLRGNV